MSGHTADPRVDMGYDVKPEVQGPYSIRRARRDGTGNDGGTLDVGIIAYTVDGTQVVIGEIWAACPDDDGGKTRIDAIQVSKGIVARLNSAPDVLEAAKAILKILTQDRQNQIGEYSIAEAYRFEDDELRTLQDAVDKAGAD